MKCGRSPLGFASSGSATGIGPWHYVLGSRSRDSLPVRRARGGYWRKMAGERSRIQRWYGRAIGEAVRERSAGSNTALLLGLRHCSQAGGARARLGTAAVAADPSPRINPSRQLRGCLANANAMLANCLRQHFSPCDCPAIRSAGRPWCEMDRLAVTRARCASPASSPRRASASYCRLSVSRAILEDLQSQGSQPVPTRRNRSGLTGARLGTPIERRKRDDPFERSPRLWGRRESVPLLRPVPSDHPAPSAARLAPTDNERLPCTGPTGSFGSVIGNLQSATWRQGPASPQGKQREPVCHGTTPN